MIFITIDQEHGDLKLRLPESCRSHQEELYTRLVELFMEEEMDEQVIFKMNEFVKAWLDKYCPEYSA